MQQFKKTRVEHKPTGNDGFESSFLTHQIQSLQSWEDVVKRNLEQLKFEASQDKYRVVLVDAATPSRTPTNNRRLSYMAAAPAVILFLLLGLFLVREVRAGRHATAG